MSATDPSRPTLPPAARLGAARVGTGRGRIAAGLVAALLIFAADQASKQWVLHGLDLPERGSVAVLPGLNLTMVWNQGVTFGLFRADTQLGAALLAAVAVAVVAVLLVWLQRAENALVATALGAIAGGAVGNIIDRLRYGAVVDFIHAHAGGWSWYVFNVADAAICCGVALLLIDGLRPRPAPT